jgi:hypothetical protein
MMFCTRSYITLAVLSSGKNFRRRLSFVLAHGKRLGLVRPRYLRRQLDHLARSAPNAADLRSLFVVATWRSCLIDGHNVAKKLGGLAAQRRWSVAEVRVEYVERAVAAALVVWQFNRVHHVLLGHMVHVGTLNTTAPILHGERSRGCSARRGSFSPA